jgi:chromate reductase, NAD(P)H dehydrogenase (quinone)
MAHSKPHVLGIAGSLRREAYSLAVLRGLEEAVRDRVRFEIFPLHEVPLYNADLDGEEKPAGVVAFKNAIRHCDAMVISSPEYNYGISGVLKNALDWASRPGYQSVLKGKPVLIVTSSPGMVGGVRAQAQLRQLLFATLSHVVAVPEVVISQVKSKVTAGVLTDKASLDFMFDAFGELLAAIPAAAQ